jgi:2-hydroxychromene-2-carboxylate isomerase
MELLENNRRRLYSLGIWGTPSFRLLDDRGVQKSAWWGQDRLWIVSREIQRLLAFRNQNTM